MVYITCDCHALFSKFKIEKFMIKNEITKNTLLTQF